MKTFLTNIKLMVVTLTASNVMITKHFNETTNIQTQLYVLGDSLSDNGNLDDILTYDTWNIDKVSFKNPFYHNSFTNGEVTTSILAQKLGTTLTTTAWYKDVNNYAVGGAQATQNDSLQYQLFLNHYAIDHQVTQLLKDHQLQKNDEVFIEIGGNNLLNVMDENSLTKQEKMINDDIATKFKAVETLIDAGAHNLMIANVPNISSIPRYVNQSQDVKTLANNLSIEYNNKWNDKIKTLIKEKSDVNIKPFDLQSSFNNLLLQAKNITNKSVRWTFTDLFLNLKPIYINKTTQETINNNFFFDYVHPNKWSHNQIGIQLFNTINW